jgi:hypothetical protein
MGVFAKLYVHVNPALPSLSKNTLNTLLCKHVTLIMNQLNPYASPM